jgi:hypothetical protein
MTEQQKTEAHAAIDKYVHSYLKSRDALYLEEDWLPECHDYFDTYAPLCKGEDRASILLFARRAAGSCLSKQFRRRTRQKRRERVAFFRLANARGENLSQKRTAALVHEALQKLPLEQVEILLCFMGNDENTLHRIAEKRRIPWGTFSQYDVPAAKTAFIDIYQKLINERN